MFLIGLLNDGADSRAASWKIQTLQFYCVTFQDVQMNYNLTVDKKKCKYGGICGVWIKRGEDDKSLISLFAFHCPVFAKASAHKGPKREEQAQVARSPLGGSRF